MSDQDIMSEFVELNKAYIARGDRIQELESAIREHKNERRTDWLSGKYAPSEGDRKLWSVLTEDRG